MDFLLKYGVLHIAQDSNDEPGCDFKLNNNIQIEAVCSSRGNEKKWIKSNTGIWYYDYEFELDSETLGLDKLRTLYYKKMYNKNQKG